MPDALRALDTAVALNPDAPDAHNNRGIALAQAGRVQEAAGEFETALRLNPNHPNPRRNLDQNQTDGASVKGNHEDTKITKGARRSRRHSLGYEVLRALPFCAPPSCASCLLRALRVSFVLFVSYLNASSQMSLRMPAAVTDGPAPGPLTTSGSSR